MGKSLFAGRDLPAGHKLTADDIVLKSPGGGIAPYEFENVVGRTLKTAISEDQPFSMDCLS
jgi:sialic acid synthase